MRTTIAVLLLYVAIVALGWEVYVFSQTASYRLIATGELWQRFDAASLALAQELVAQYAHPLAWKQAVEPILTWPLWAVAGAPGLLLLAVTLKRNPRAKAVVYRSSAGISAGELHRLREGSVTRAPAVTS